MPCRVTAKRRHKKVKKRPLFAFCAALPTEQENTQPALQTLLTNGKIHIVQLLSQQSFHLSVHLLPYKRKPKSTLTAYEKEPHSDVLDRPVIGMWLFRFLIVCTAVFLVMLYARLSFANHLTPFFRHELRIHSFHKIVQFSGVHALIHSARRTVNDGLNIVSGPDCHLIMVTVDDLLPCRVHKFASVCPHLYRLKRPCTGIEIQ